MRLPLNILICILATVTYPSRFLQLYVVEGRTIVVHSMRAREHTEDKAEWWGRGLRQIASAVGVDGG